MKWKRETTSLQWVNRSSNTTMISKKLNSSYSYAVFLTFLVCTITNNRERNGMEEYITVIFQVDFGIDSSFSAM